MRFDGFITDIAVESAENVGLLEACKVQELDFGITKRSLNVKTKEMAKAVGRSIGAYTTFDCDKTIYSDPRSAKAIEAYLAQTIKRTIGVKNRSNPTLVVGLGNGNIAADSLGERVFDKIEVSSKDITKSATKPPVCAISTSVLGKTGIETAKLITGVVKEISPSFVLLVDSLATSVPRRVGLSFQLTTAGIAPGSGIVGDKEKIDSDVLGVPLLSIGVPTLLALNTLTYNLFKDYLNNLKMQIDEYAFRSLLSDKAMSNMVVAPKDVDVCVENAANVIASAINSALK